MTASPWFLPHTVFKQHSRLPDPVLAVLLLLLPTLASAADISASVDRTAVARGETVELTLESTGDPGASPDLSVLAGDFEIVDRRTSLNVSIVNGARSERHLLMLRLLPRRAGELRIPAIPVGDTATLPLPLSVAVSTAGAATRVAATVTVPPPTIANDSMPPPTVTLEATLEPDRAYSSQQLVLTVKVFMDGPIQRPRLHDPQIQDAQVLPLGEDHYEAQHNGKSIRVYERRYAIFPRAPGRLEIDPLLFEGWAPAASSPDSGVSYAAPGQPLRALSQALATDVRSPASGTDPAAWLPARSLVLSESGPEIYRAFSGQPIERRISRRAEGIMAHDLPPLKIDVPHQITIRPGQARMWDERRPEGVIGTRNDVFTLTAGEPGRYRLPPVSLDWWNTTADKWETAMLPARELVVSAGTATTPAYPEQVSALEPEPWQQATGPDYMEVIEETPAAMPPAPQDESGDSGGLWARVAAALGLAWIATLLGWWRSRRRKVVTEPTTPSSAEQPVVPEERDPLQQEVDAVRTAYESGDAGAAREALLTWAQQALPEQPPSNLARLAQRCVEPLRSQVLLLEEAFFSPSPVAWDKQPVWEGLQGFVPTPLEEPASHRRGKPIRRRAPNPDAE